MSKLSARLSSSGTMIAALSLLVALPLSLFVPTQPSGNVSTCRMNSIPRNATLMVPADNDNADDSDKFWLPCPGAAIMLTPEKAEQLEGTEDDKKKLRNAMTGWQLMKKMKNHMEDPPTSQFFKPHRGVIAGRVLNGLGYRSDYCTQPKDLTIFGFDEAVTDLGISTSEKDCCLTKITHSIELGRKSSESAGSLSTDQG